MQKSSAKNQYLATFIVNLLTFGHGVACGWSSPNVDLLTSNRTPLPSGIISMDEASWVASLLCLGGLFGNIFFGFVTNAYGRRFPLLLLTIPAIAGWLLVLYSQNVYHLYAARLISGFVGGGALLLCPLFLSEIASDRIRGILGSTVVLSCNLGILLAFTVGSYFDYDKTPKIVVGITIICAITLYFFPETPTFLMKQGNVSETEKSIRFYRNIHGGTSNYETIKSEMERLRSSIKGSKADQSKESSFGWSDVFSRTGRKAMSIGIVLAAINQFSGCFAMLNYTENIFKEAGSSMSPSDSAIVIAIIQLIGATGSMFLVDRAGRRFLFGVSTIGTALGLITMGVYSLLKSWEFDVAAYNWIPVASFSWAIFIASLAVMTLPFLVISEIMPESIKDFGQTSCVALVWISAFSMVKLLPLLTEALAFHGIMFLFAGCCLSSALFILVCMPETKGRSYEQIMDSL